MRVQQLIVATCSLMATASAQTIKVDGQTVQADESNVEPPVETVSGYEGFESKQLTEATLANLTDLQLSNISLFYFDDEVNSAEKRALYEPKCKVLPGDAAYPSKALWKIFDILTGGALIKTVPLGAACYQGEHYDSAKCTYLLNNWNRSYAHVDDPTSVMSPLYENATCQPADAARGKECTIGGYSEYSVNISSVSQIQLGINFARALNLRLVVHNTGHDFLGKNTGRGALSLWTHHLRDIKLIKNYKSAGGRYTGPAFKLGAGVMVYELYEAAEREGYLAVGGECRTVGVSGGYLAGGGHSPISSIHGLGSDQVLSVDLVTPDGRFITADETQNQDLFWAIRGGGGATWGVVTSMTVKVHEKKVMSGMTWDTTTVAMNVTDDQFWRAIEAYWSRYSEYLEANSYGYCRMSALPTGGYAWRGLPWMIPGMKLVDFKKLVQPLLDEWAAIGVDPKPKFFEHESFYDAWSNHFPIERTGSPYARTANRLLPRENWEEPEIRNKTIQTIRSVVEEGAFLVHYNMKADVQPNTADSAANPAWRDLMMFTIIGVTWDENTTQDQVDVLNDKLTNDLNKRIKDVSPNGGGYLNEGDVMDPDFQKTFYGDHYERLLQIKKKVDPRDVFWAPTAVGSEGWYITDQNKYVTKQTGRLCPRQ
ncbi:unnamed protein product [Clonostachys solani]|uniref:FAD-binding PCMH-type domain-containing protein n=1 Tax=Clonostachys solani TaxID=160281 RepID=A0A9P0ELF8_9HYPO|nr:unnamed protein product [Clonostachys solani]